MCNYVKHNKPIPIAFTLCKRTKSCLFDVSFSQSFFSLGSLRMNDFSTSFHPIQKRFPHILCIVLQNLLSSSKAGCRRPLKSLLSHTAPHGGALNLSFSVVVVESGRARGILVGTTEREIFPFSEAERHQDEDSRRVLAFSSASSSFVSFTFSQSVSHSVGRASPVSQVDIPPPGNQCYC